MRMASVFGLFLSVALSFASAPPGDVTFHIVSTTDFHGHLLEQEVQGGLNIGGLDTMSGFFDVAKQSDKETLFLDSGDLFQGTLLSNSSGGAPVIRWMNYVGYAAAAVGNHEFDFGPGNGDAVVVHPGQDPLGVLKERAKEAKFKFLSANICSVDEDPLHCSSSTSFKVASLVEPYLIHTVHGIRLGVVALTTPHTPEVTMPSNVSRLRFMPMKETLERFVPEMKAKGADAIVVVLHDGGFCPNGQCNPKDPVFELIDSLKPEVKESLPLFLAGHTHNYVNTIYHGVRVMIAGAYGKSFGYTTLTFHGADRKLTVDKTDNVDFCTRVFPDTQSCFKGKGTPVAPMFLGREVVPNSTARHLLQKDIDIAQRVASLPVGRALSPLTKGTRGEESSLGDLTADAFRYCKEASCASSADIAFENNGGIRSSFLKAGPVTYGQIFETLPFDNVHCDLQLTGTQVHDFLDAFFAGSADKSMPQVSGLQIVYSPARAKPRLLKNSLGETQTIADPILSLKTPDGKPLEDSRVYHVVLGDFLATGGEGTAFVLKGLKPPPEVHYERKQRDQLVDFFKANPAGVDYSTIGNRLILQK